ncbi:MAG: tetratricopeptide repeat protein, partial [Polyangiaceae bacterium]
GRVDLPQIGRLRRPQGEVMKRALAIALACAMSVPSVAFAQNASTMADARFHEGLAFVQAGEYEQARLAFEQAYAISKDPTTLWNLALAEMKTNHPVEAIRHFRQFKRDPKANPQDLPTCTNLIERMEAQTCHVTVKTAPGAEITVDGERWTENAPTSDPIDIGEGVHTIRVQLGTRWASKDVDGVKGQEITITLDVGEAPPPDNRDHVVPPPSHEKAVAFPPPTGAIILGGVGIVGLGLGVGFGLDAMSAKSDGQDQEKAQPCSNPTSAACGAIHDTQDHANRSALISNIGFIGGGALLAGGIVWWLVAPRKVEESAQIVPIVKKDFAGISVGRSF